MWSLAKDLIALAAGLLFPVATGLLARWTLGMSTPRKDARQARRIYASICDTLSGTWHRAGIWTHEQMGFTDLKLRALKRKIDQGAYQEDLAT